MKIFTVLEIKDLNAEVKNNQWLFIEEGFSFYALIFQFFWFIYHRVWGIAAIILTSDVTLSLLQKNNIITESIFIALRICLSLSIGIFAKTWYIQHLKSNNYKFKTVIAAKSEEQAKLKFYEMESQNV